MVEEQLLVTLVRLSTAPEFQEVLEHFQEQLDKADKDNRRLSGEPLYRSQGRALFIEEFLNRVSKARENVEKMRAKRNP